MQKKQTRSTNNVMIAGVAAGVANYVNIDPVLVRLIFFLMALTGGHGPLVYLILWLIMPKENLAEKVEIS